MSDTNKAPFRLQLTADALNALFPPGSEARVELQRSCIQEFTKRHVGQEVLGASWECYKEKVLNDVRSTFTTRLDAVKNEFLGKLVQEEGSLVKKDYWANTFTLSERGRQQVRDELESLIKSMVQEIMTTQLKTVVEDAAKRMASRGVVEHNINAELIKQIKAQVIAKLAE